MFKKVLIANRGEIAIRIIRTCKEMQIRTVAVYSEADKNSLHVRLADEAHCIGASKVAESYLNQAAVLTAALKTKADAIHPGYGFLAENADFAAKCREVGITFIGPPPEAIRKMGDKASARKQMSEAGVPVIQGSEGTVDEGNVHEHASKIGYPLMIKAASGGGGKGMRIVEQADHLERMFALAKQEAEANFGDGRMYLETYIETPRHIEVQIIADQYGQVVHLGERDCTVQRRHQKLIEEAPSPHVNEQLRQSLGEAAVKAAQSVSYVGAGTIEFLVDRECQFYFMEMNTRIQVEHPVSEQVTGIDLIKEQMLVAAGEPLRYCQEDILLNGHSIECRINAEDPSNEFAPNPGMLTHYAAPGGRNVRIDSAVYAGATIPPYYDSMVAKLIVYGATRAEAIESMKRALDEFEIEGVQTTIPVLRKVMQHKNFRDGDFDTNFFEKHLKPIPS
ncbi:acetyl-CoA carboxylase biotin carboxylase subunit [Shouchella clausii]|uniref:acetyl-CoA carboxylase biotin carboxylase subunit n=1 Tax=Shouchella clausii TaxID=79880 RepID=UPI0031FDFFC3